MTIPSPTATINGIINGITPIAVWLWNAANSNFGTALVGAGAGAIAGALAAQKIAERSEIRRAQIEQIRSANVAITIAIAIGNAFGGLKRQYVLPIQADLKRLSEAYAEYKISYPVKTSATPAFVFDADMKMLSPIPTLITELKTILFGRTDPIPRALALYQHLSTAINNCDDMLRQRNAILEEFRATPASQVDRIVYAYLGLPRSDGGTDARYSTLVEGIALQTDDIIVFSKELAEALMEHGRSVAGRLGKGAPKIAIAHFGRLEELGLLPDMSSYQELLAALRGNQPPPVRDQPPSTSAPS